MNYESTQTFKSTTTPGVSFTLVKINVRQRLLFNLKMAKQFEELRAIYRKRKPFDDAYQDAIKAAREKARPEIDALMQAESLTREDAIKRLKIPLDFAADKLDQMVALIEEADTYDAREVTPELVRYFLASIEGLTIDGEAATAALLIDKGPDELYREIAAAIAQQMGMTPEEKTNLQFAGTSKQPADGSAMADPAVSSTTATTAAHAATTS